MGKKNKATPKPTPLVECNPESTQIVSATITVRNPRYVDRSDSYRSSRMYYRDQWTLSIPEAVQLRDALIQALTLGGCESQEGGE